MFDERRRKRRLKKKIAALKAREAEMQEGFIPEEPGDKPEMPMELQFSLHSYGRELDELETDQLLRKAHGRGIKFPSESSWWYEDTDYEGREVHYLTDIGKAGVWRLIRDDKRATIEWWAKILVPVLTTLISILSLIVALVSVSKK